jgi:hypothetical protein
MGKIITSPVQKKIKHTKESQRWADILHKYWPEEFGKDGSRLPVKGSA